jgi:hypothetical protein
MFLCTKRITSPDHLLLIIVLLTVCAIQAPGDVIFSGQTSTDLGFRITGDSLDDRYESPINPANIMGISDIMRANRIEGRIDEGSGDSAYSCWFSFKQFPLAEVFYGVALAADDGTPSSVTGTAADLFTILDNRIMTADIMRLSYTWFSGDRVRITLGRQSLFTGYGYGWNPIDFANPQKDPSDPEQDLKGVDAVSLLITPAEIFTVKSYAILPFRNTDGITWGDLRGGTELTLLINALEVKAHILFGFDTEGSPHGDPYPFSLGLAGLADIGGVGFYGEAAFRKGSRAFYTDGTSNSILNTREDWVFSSLAGIEYVFPWEMSLIAEYFYNGEGYDQNQREDYANTLQDWVSTTGFLPGSVLKLYRPGYFARHYLMLSLIQPFYIVESDLSLMIMASSDSACLYLNPAYQLYLSGSLTVAISYSGSFSIEDNRFNEAWLAPVHHTLNLKAIFRF